MRTSVRPPASNMIGNCLLRLCLACLLALHAVGGIRDARHQAPTIENVGSHQLPVREEGAPGRRRRLASTLAAPLDASATRRAQRDAEPDPTHVPEPHLYYDNDLLIWAPEDTLPRDVLARRPEIWLYCLLRPRYGAAALLPHFLEHYSRLGIQADRMIFVVQAEPGSDGALAATEALLRAFGADFRVWRGRFAAEAHLAVQLRALQRVPVQDWVVVADGEELHDFGGVPAQLFLERREREGANWVRAEWVERAATSGRLEPVAPLRPALETQFPLRCAVGRQRSAAAASSPRVAAFRGYLRPGLDGRGVVLPEQAAQYFGAAAPGNASARVGLCGGQDLLELTPYARWWQYYRTPTMVGNAYLWYPRASDTSAATNHFRWHSGAVQRVAAAEADRHRSDLPCSAAAPGQEAAEVVAAVVRRGGVDVNNAELACTLAPRAAARLPLGEAAARGLARVRHLAARQQQEALAARSDR